MVYKNITPVSEVTILDKNSGIDTYNHDTINCRLWWAGFCRHHDNDKGTDFEPSKIFNSNIIHFD